MQNSREKHVIVDVETWKVIKKDTRDKNSEDQRSRKRTIFHENHAITKQTKEDMMYFIVSLPGVVVSDEGMNSGLIGSIQKLRFFFTFYMKQQT